MIIIAVLLCMFINKSKLTDPSTWGMGADVAVQNSPMYDQSAGGQQVRLLFVCLFCLFCIFKF